MTKITISKTDAARNQLGTAISLFFEDGDPVSIHTLTAAALGILHDCFPDVGMVWDNNLMLHYNSIYIEDEHRREWIEKVREPANFFKHADRDLKNGKTEIEFTPEITAFHLLEAIRCLGIIEGNNFQFLPEFRVYIAWFALRYPHLIKDEGKHHFAGLKNTINPDNLSEFKTALTMLRENPHL